MPSSCINRLLPCSIHRELFRPPIYPSINLLSTLRPPPRNPHKRPPHIRPSRPLRRGHSIPLKRRNRTPIHPNLRRPISKPHGTSRPPIILYPFISSAQPLARIRSDESNASRPPHLLLPLLSLDFYPPPFEFDYELF